ncbi:uncharacterized protein TNIN_232741 [Trichonephila inaurata madagascariensis]|uniref:Mutator-like transposase domain-containing protein n=1 Tax=Trichonephila inaurata madagascariensis TaxID=2747483 RepID=A0A8X6MAJ2_9ARAC|nr:uncharacterized protein TNIN_232741 [Trichonephila inaurata madagascariensis]
MQALLKAKKRWAPGQLELEHPSFHDNDPNATCHASSNYVNNAEVNTCTLTSSELNAATERKLSLLSHTSVEHLANEQDDTTYVLVDTNIWKNLLSTVKCPKCDMKDLNIIKTTQLGMASKLVLVCSSCEAVLNSSFSSARVKEKNFFDINKKMVSSFLRLGKGHAGLELFALVTGMNAMDKKSFSKHIKTLSEENSEMKHQILEVARNIVRKQHLDLNDEEKEETGMIGITHNGAISFISELFTGSISDKEVFIRIKLMDRLEPNDVVMADKGFLIANELEKIGCKLYRPIFLEDKIQFYLSEMFTSFSPDIVMEPAQQPDNSGDRDPSPTSDEGIADESEKSESNSAQVGEPELAAEFMHASDFFNGKHLVLVENAKGDQIIVVMSGEESGPSRADSGSDLNDQESADVPEGILIEYNDPNSSDDAEASPESANSPSGDLKKS